MSDEPGKKQLADMIRDESLSPQDRGDMLLYTLTDEGLDHREVLRQLLAEADLGRALRERMESMTRSTLASERFLGSFQPSPATTYAIVTNGQQVVYLPTTHEEIADYRTGEPVLIDMESRRIVGRDGATPLSCEIVTIESRPPDHPQHAVIQQHDQLEFVRLHHELVGQRDGCQPGDQVLFDPVRKFVLGKVDTQSDGCELLIAPESLARVSLEDVAAVHPVIDEIVDRFRAAVEHPDWSRAMKVRQRCSYLFVGTTGTGKSFQLKLLINMIHDLVEKYTGRARVDWSCSTRPISGRPISGKPSNALPAGLQNSRNSDR